MMTARTAEQSTICRGMNGTAIPGECSAPRPKRLPQLVTYHRYAFVGDGYHLQEEIYDDDNQFPGGVYPNVYIRCLIKPMSKCLKSLEATRRYLSVATLFLAFKLLYFSTIFKKIGIFTLIVFRWPDVLNCLDSILNALNP